MSDLTIREASALCEQAEKEVHAILARLCAETGLSASLEIVPADGLPASVRISLEVA